MVNKKQVTNIIAVILVFIMLISLSLASEVIKRTPATELTRNPDGTNTCTLFGSEMFIDINRGLDIKNYVLINDSYFPIISSTNGLYSYQLDNLYTNYSAYFRNNSNTVGAVRFEKEGYFFTYDLSGGQLQWREQPGFPARTDTLGGGAPSNSQNTQINTSGNMAIYEGAFFNTTLKYYLKKNMMKELFILKGLPSIKPYTYLEYTGNIKFNSSLQICANNVCYKPSGTQDDFATSGRIDFKDSNNKTIFYLPAPTATDSNNNTVNLIYSVHGSNAQMNFWLRIPTSFIQTATFPIYIDPSIKLNTANTEVLDDSYILNDTNADTNYGTDSPIFNYIVGTNEAHTIFKYNFIKDIFQYTDASFCFYITGNGLDASSEGYNVTGYLLNKSYVWNESMITYNNRPLGINLTNNKAFQDIKYFGGAGEQLAWQCMNFTQAMNNTLLEGGYNNFSFYLYTHDVYGTPSAGDVITIESKETGDSIWTPYLNLTYIPYISIILPTSNQIFSQDAPTAYFNISTSVNMSNCYWNENNVNYTLTRLNDTYFYLINSTMSEGYHNNIIFYCNESSNGNWHYSDSLNIFVDSKNLTKCRNIYTERQYEIINNIDDLTTTDCLLTKADMSYFNINGNNYWINKSKGGNITFVPDSSPRPEINFTDITFYLNGSGLYHLIDTSALLFKNVNIYGRYDIVKLFDPWYSDVYFYNSLINNTIINTSRYTSTYFFLINTTLQNVTEIAGKNGNEIYRDWYFNSNVKNNLNNNLQYSSITASTNDNTTVFTSTTDSSGNIAIQTIREYFVNNSGKFYYTPHNITTSASGYATNITIYNFTILQQSINQNTTLIDNQPPSISIFSPLAQNYNTNSSLLLNYYATDNLVTLSSCWYKITNLTDIIVNNVTLPNCQAVYFNLPGNDDDYNLTVYSNDTTNNIGSTTVNFGVRINVPAVNINYPSNNLWLTSGSNVLFNFTSTFRTGLDTCRLWSNFTGSWAVNYSWVSPTNATANWTYINLNDGLYTWNIACNNSLNLLGWANSNYSINIDTIVPNVTINSINTFPGNMYVYLSNTITDNNLNTSSCKYSIYDSTNTIYESMENVSFTCNSLTEIDLTDFGKYNITVYAKDYAEQETNSKKSFSISVAPSGGGGGTLSISSPTIPVIGINANNMSRNYSALEKEIIYSYINSQCLQKIQTAETVAIADYSKVCNLVNEDFNVLLEKLAVEGVGMPISDLKKFYTLYKEQSLFQGAETQDKVNKYNLFTSILGNVNVLTLNPPSIDKAKLITSNNANVTITEIVYSNKPLKSCEIVGNTTGLTCEVTTTTLKIIYKLSNTDFFNKNFQAIVSVTTDAPAAEIEQKKLPIVFRVYNLTYKSIPFIAFGIIACSIGLFVYIKKRKKRRSALQQIFE